MKSFFVHCLNKCQSSVLNIGKKMHMWTVLFIHCFKCMFLFALLCCAIKRVSVFVLQGGTPDDLLRLTWSWLGQSRSPSPTSSLIGRKSLTLKCRCCSPHIAFIVAFIMLLGCVSSLGVMFWCMLWVVYHVWMKGCLSFQTHFSL